jgi:CubicO group peptidase (beta-lactamase class C family)
MGNSRRHTLVIGPALALILSACATVESNFDLSFSDIDGFHDDRLNRIDAAIEAEIEAGGVAGAVAVIAKDGDIVYDKAFGYADIDSGKPMETSSIFRIASMTKAITSVGVMILHERGHFMLNDPISDFIPAFANPRVAIAFDDDGNVTETRPASREISIIDLLSHSSGITYAFIDQPLKQSYERGGVIDGLTARPLVLADVMQRLAEQPLLFDPGSEFAYGLNTDVLGYLIEVVSGMSLDAFFAEEIFGPLGMTDTYFYLPDDKADRLVTLYAEVDGELRVSDGTEADIKLDNPRYPVEGAKTYFAGGAGLSSTAYDYFRFVQMLLNEGDLYGRRVLSRKSVELMQAPRIAFPWAAGSSFALGFGVIDDLGRYGELGTEGTYSWGGAFNTSYWIDPEENLVGVIMTQVRPYTSDITARFQSLVYQALE